MQAAASNPDPHAEVAVRAVPGRHGPLFDAVVVGSGFSGLCMAIKLRAAGLSFVVLEQAASLGGTWRDNTYPGAACDVQSNLYCFSFAPKPDWSRSYPRQGELEAYLNDCADRFGVRDGFRFGRRVVLARFDEATLRWQVETEGGETWRARSLVLATGGLSRPRMPDIPGLDDFKGALFHTARWNHGEPLAGKRVAVIGTGASAIQAVPELAKVAGQLDVYQRTPPWIIPKPDFPVSPRRRALRARQPWRQRLDRAWTYAWHEAWAVGFTRWPWMLRLVQGVVGLYLRWQVRDPALRKKLRPDYVIGCKRVLLSNDYYPALQRDNVRLLATPVAAITPEGIETGDGLRRHYDAIVACTGFQAADACAPFAVHGLGGRRLDEAWRPRAGAYLGTVVAGFPNLFLMTGPNTALGHNSMVYMIEAQAHYVMAALQRLSRRPGVAMDVRDEVQADYNAWLQARLARTVWSTGGCRSWYLSREGDNTTLWPDFTFAFRRRLRRLDEADYRWLGGGVGANGRENG